MGRLAVLVSLAFVGGAPLLAAPRVTSSLHGARVVAFSGMATHLFVDSRGDRIALGDRRRETELRIVGVEPQRLLGRISGAALIDAKLALPPRASRWKRYEARRGAIVSWAFIPGTTRGVALHLVYTIPTRRAQVGRQLALWDFRSGKLLRLLGGVIHSYADPSPRLHVAANGEILALIGGGIYRFSRDGKPLTWAATNVRVLKLALSGGQLAELGYDHKTERFIVVLRGWRGPKLGAPRRLTPSFLNRSQSCEALAMSGKRWLWFLIRSQRRTLHLLRYAPKSNELRRFELGIQAYRDQIRLIARPDGVRLFILRQRPGKRPLETQIVAEQIDLDRYGTRRRRRREIAIPLPYRREFSPLFRVEESGRRWFLGFWGHRRAFRVDFPR